MSRAPVRFLAGWCERRSAQIRIIRITIAEVEGRHRSHKLYNASDLLHAVHWAQAMPPFQASLAALRCRARTLHLSLCSSQHFSQACKSVIVYHPIYQQRAMRTNHRHVLSGDRLALRQLLQPRQARLPRALEPPARGPAPPRAVVRRCSRGCARCAAVTIGGRCWPSVMQAEPRRDCSKRAVSVIPVARHGTAEQKTSQRRTSTDLSTARQPALAPIRCVELAHLLWRPLRRRRPLAAGPLTSASRAAIGGEHARGLPGLRCQH